MSNHVDLAPTLLDYAGLPIPSDMQGHSLRGILEGKAQKVRDASYYHFYSHGDNNLPEMIGIRTSTHKLIHYPGMKGKYQWELFDLKKDPEEMQNQYTNPEYAQTKQELLTGLRKLINDLEDPVDAPNLVKTVLP
jgi:arylsulfatase A-like enzyme